MTTPAITETDGQALTLDRGRVLHLAPDQSAAALAVDEGAWSHMNAVAEFRNGRVLGVFEYGSTWDYWERHPVGVEVVHTLQGSVRFHLHDGHYGTAVRLVAGQSLLVPEGVWHRAEVVTSAQLLFVTPTPAITEHREARP